MQGYIINFNRIRDEDLIVTLLTKEKIETLYRFYGARHSYIQLGYKVDFEIETSPKAHFGRMRNILHLHYDYLFCHDSMHAWQNFLKLLYKHLKNAEQIEPFYFELLEELSLKLKKSNPKRVIIEGLVKLLEFEGRLHDSSYCYFCGEKIVGEKLALVRGFLPAHRKCVYAKEIGKYGVDTLFKEKNSAFLEEEEIEIVWETLLLGI